MLKVKIDRSTYGIEIQKAIMHRTRRNIATYNIKKAEKYLKDAQRWGDPTVIAFAERELEKTKIEEAKNLNANF